MKSMNLYIQYPFLKKIIIYINSFSVALSMVGYACLIVSLVVSTLWILLPKFILIPLNCIAIVEVCRHFIKRQRPFELYQYQPLIPHKTGGSFPSKHATSAMIIALSIHLIYPTLGIIFVINALFVGISRYLLGLHHASDILAGYTLAIFLHFIYYI